MGMLTHLSPDSFITTRWSGGLTTQLLIAPAGADYANRDFLWRVSSATVELEESDFTPLPDYHRFLSTLRGEIALRHNGGKEIILRPGEIDSFSGADATHSAGRCVDFNLMLRNGMADGSLRCLSLGIGFSDCPVDPRAENALLYCAEGKCVVSGGAETISLTTGHALLTAGFSSVSSLALDCTEPAMLMLAQMWRLPQRNDP